MCSNHDWLERRTIFYRFFDATNNSDGDGEHGHDQVINNLGHVEPVSNHGIHADDRGQHQKHRCVRNDVALAAKLRNDNLLKIKASIFYRYRFAYRTLCRSICVTIFLVACVVYGCSALAEQPLPAAFGQAYVTLIFA